MIERKAPTETKTVAPFSVQSTDPLQDVFFLQSGKVMSITHSGIVKIWDLSVSTTQKNDDSDLTSSNDDKKNENGCILTHEIKPSAVPGIKIRSSYPRYYLHHLGVMECLLPEGPVLSQLNDRIKCLTNSEEFTYRALCQDSKLIAYTNRDGIDSWPITKFFIPTGNNEYVIRTEKTTQKNLGSGWSQSTSNHFLAVFKKSATEFKLAKKIPFPNFFQISPAMADTLVTAKPYHIEVWKKNSKDTYQLAWQLKSPFKEQDAKNDPINGEEGCSNILKISDHKFVIIFGNYDLLRFCKLNLKTQSITKEITHATIIKGGNYDLRKILPIDQTTFVMEFVGIGGTRENQNEKYHHIFNADTMTLHALEIEPGFSCMDVNDAGHILISNGKEFKLMEFPQIKQFCRLINPEILTAIATHLNTSNLPELIGEYLGSDARLGMNTASFFGKNIEKSLSDTTYQHVETSSVESGTSCSVM